MVSGVVDSAVDVDSGGSILDEDLDIGTTVGFALASCNEGIESADAIEWAWVNGRAGDAVSHASMWGMPSGCLRTCVWVCTYACWNTGVHVRLHVGVRVCTYACKALRM